MTRSIKTKYGPTLIPYPGGYRVNVIHQGKRYQRKFPTSKDALLFLDELYAPPERAKVGSDVDELVREYLRWSELDAKKGFTWVKSLEQMLGVFQRHVESVGLRRLSQITAEHMRSFRTDWLAYNKHRSENTWEKYRQAVSSFLNWANKRDPKVINVAADSEFKRKVHQNAPETLEQDEIELLLKYFDSQGADPNWIGTAIRILLYTGIRLGELVALKWTDVDLRQQVLRCGTKTKKTRTVPIAEKLLPYIRSLPRSKAFVFDDGRGNQLYHRKRYYQDLQKACAIMEIKRRSIHSLRHTFIRYLLEAGTPINEVAKIAGHEDIRTTMRYAQHFSISRAKDAVNTLPY